MKTFDERWVDFFTGLIASSHRFECINPIGPLADSGASIQFQYFTILAHAKAQRPQRKADALGVLSVFA